MNKCNHTKFLRAVWCKDSETGKTAMICCDCSEIIITKEELNSETTKTKNEK